MTQEPILTARGLVKRYGRVTALDNADFDLYPGEILAVIGDNGAGKSSLIKAISGAITPGRRRDHAGGQVDRTSSRRWRRATPASRRSTRTWRCRRRCRSPTTCSSAARSGKPGFLGEWLRMLDRPAMEKRARAKLTELGLMTIQNIGQAVETLSGGQRQGVAVARAAAFGSKVIIMDEPTAALGVKESRRVLELILDVKRRGAADRAHLAQHAACLRGGRPHPHPPARPSAHRHRSEGIHDVGRRRLHDRRQDAAGAGAGGVACRSTGKVNLPVSI